MGEARPAELTLVFSSSPHALCYHALAALPSLTQCQGVTLDPVDAVVATEAPEHLTPCLRCFRYRPGRGTPQRISAQEQRRQLMHELTQGRTLSEAASLLGIGVRTASRYVTALSDDLGATTHLQLGYLLGLASAQSGEAAPLAHVRGIA